MNRLDEFMGKQLISENIDLSAMLDDIIPVNTNRFTNIELEADKKQEFRIVVYKKENILVRFWKNLKFGLEKLNIIKRSKSFVKYKQEN